MRAARFIILPVLAISYLTGCCAKCKPLVPVTVWCEAPQPAEPELVCPPLLTEADVARCAMLRDTARAAHEAALAAALKSCRKPSV